MLLDVREDARARRLHAAALPGQRHRHRHSAGEARHDLRGVQPGRRLDDAALRRHRARADDFLDPGAADGRAHLGRERARRTAAPFTSPPASTSPNWRRREPAPEPLLAELPVLIVDDNAVNRRILHDAADPLAHAADRRRQRARGARRACRPPPRPASPFALVLLDANMPDLDGFQVAEQIAARPELAGATIMMLSSSGQHGDTVALPRAGHLGLSHQADPGRRSARRDLPRAQPRRRRRPSAAAARPSTAPARVRRCRVLLAEDNIVNQRVAVGLLTKRGHTVTVANNGREALAALDRGDVRPRADGRADAGDGRVRGDRRHPASASASTGGHLRIVAMTAHAMNGDRERCLAAGMDGYLSKPIDPDAALRRVEHRRAAGPARHRAAAARGRPRAGRSRSA